MTPPSKPSLAEELNKGVDCEDLALRLGLERPDGRGNFRNPHTGPKAGGRAHSPTLSTYRDKGGRSRWMDHREGSGGGPIDLYQLVKSCDDGTAIRELAEMYPHVAARARPAQAAAGAAQAGPRPERSRAEWIADKCLAGIRSPANLQAVMDYLTGRGLTERAVQTAIDRHAIGFNDYTSTTVAAGEAGHGGPGVAFIVRHPSTGQVLAVETRYFDAQLNGGQKTSTQGEKNGAPWAADWKRFAAARTVVVCESAINALSVDSCNLAGVVGFSLQGAGNARNCDWRLMLGKRVVLGFDNDEPEASGKLAGYCPGTYYAWQAHEALVALDIPALMLDQDDWTDDDEEPINDLNDLLQARGVEGLSAALKKLEPWLIPGMHGKGGKGKPRIWLPAHDFSVYWKYRVREDFTSYVDKYKKNEETGQEDFELSNVCGFRVAAVSRIRVASAMSMMTGDKDLSPRTLYALTVQVPRESDTMLRRVVEDDQVHNLDVWKKFGPVYRPAAFSRLLNIMERAADLGARDAINFVGLAWKRGTLVVNEARDCYFKDPSQQCPYWNLVFPSGTRETAAEIVDAYQQTFGGNNAAMVLVWALGAHLKAFIGYWPHFALQAEKGVGKGVFSNRLSRTVGLQMFSRQTMQTEFRILGSVSFTSQPVGWGEISANKKDVLAKAMHTLQECYQYEYSTRGTEKKEFLVCAPVLLVGEEVDAKTLLGKMVSNQMTLANRGPEMPANLPVFPVRQWLEFLAATPKEKVLELHAEAREAMAASCSAKREDAGAQRMLNNYAAMRTAWTLLCDFAGLSLGAGNFLRDLTAQMNAHIKESTSDRQPWVWILETLLSEISAGKFRHPFAFKQIDEEEVLCVRTSHVMDHMGREQSLREFFDHLPVKSDRVFKAQLKAAGVLADEDIECTVHGKRVGHMVALSLPALGQYGLYAVVPTNLDPTQPE